MVQLLLSTSCGEQGHSRVAEGPAVIVNLLSEAYPAKVAGERSGADREYRDQRQELEAPLPLVIARDRGSGTGVGCERSCSGVRVSMHESARSFGSIVLVHISQVQSIEVIHECIKDIQCARGSCVRGYWVFVKRTGREHGLCLRQ